MIKKKTTAPVLRSKRLGLKTEAPIVNAAPVQQNGLSEAIMGFNPASIGTQINQADTLFLNMRNYLVSNMRQLLSQIYVEHGLVQTIVDVPVDDGLRGGIEIKTKQLEPEQIEELQTYLERHDIISSVVGRALKWTRLFGGAGVIVMTDQDPSTPLDEEAIKPGSNLAFRAVDMWELFWDKQNTEGGYDAAMQEQAFEHYNYYGKKLHKSRVLKMKGLEPPSFVRPRLRGWGFSVVESLITSINQYLKSNNLCFEVLDEFKIDVFKIKGLSTALLSNGGAQKVHERVQLANREKSFQHAITMDSEDDFDHKELTFGGIAEVMTGIRMQVASDMRMPLTKIFGISAAGFSSGEDDIENYNAMVESQVRAKAKYDILRLVELCCHQLFGMCPDDLKISFHSMRTLSSEQEEAVKTQKHARLLASLQAGLITINEFKDACNKDNLLGVMLDTEIEEDAPATDGGEDSGSGMGPSSPDDTQIQETALNGAQVSSMVEVVKSVAMGELPRDAAVQIIMRAFQYTFDQADTLLGEAGRGFVSKAPAGPVGPASDSVEMSRAELIAEHEALVKSLDSDPAEQKKQKAELEKLKRGE